MRGWSLLRWRVLGLLSAMLVIVALPYLVTRASTEDALEADTWVTHSAEVKSLAYQIAFEIRDSESAMYRMLDGDNDPAVRDRVEFGASDTPLLFRRLHEMSADNKAQQPAIDALGVVVNGRLALMKQALLRYAKGDRAGADAALRDSGTLFKLDELIRAIVDNEDAVLRQRRANAQMRSFRNDVVLAITALAQALLLGIIVLVSEWQIGRRIRAEARENRAIQRALMILQAVREPIALLDEQMRTLLVNTAFSELYGLPQREKRPLKLLQDVGEGAWSDSGLLQRLHDVLLHDRELWDYEIKQRTVDGMERHVLVNARRLEQDDGEAPVLLLTVSDITARALVEHQVKELNRQLEGKVEQISDANRELEAFSYSVSHDLRAPLRHIAGFAGKLERHLGEGVDETARHYLDVIRDASKRMAELIDELLVFSRLGRGALRLQTVDMQTLADEARALAESEAAGRRIVWKIAPLPVVVGDENMLRTVWQNLLGNAVKYTGQREVARITVEVRRGSDGGYTFSVADNGVGFDMEYADKLFGVFQRLHKASEFPGHGIGLANVRRIIARHGGRVWAEAAPDQGATFYFYLPPADQTGRGAN
ncbi:histidine kinase [Fulvimonas soli]|nr:histidine kinase [Fulvimonas soli]